MFLALRLRLSGSSENIPGGHDNHIRDLIACSAAHQISLSCSFPLRSISDTRSIQAVEKKADETGHDSFRSVIVGMYKKDGDRIEM